MAGESTGTEPITVDTALSNAARLLHQAELETNLSAMERIEGLADTWVNIARLAMEREHV